MELPGRKDPAACGGVRVERKVRPTGLLEGWKRFAKVWKAQGFGLSGICLGIHWAH